jgi:hypothetical protein
MYIFMNKYGLGALGSTKTGSMLNFDAFYYPLGQGATMGESFRDWFISIGMDGYQKSEMSWFYGMALLGDPTLRVVPLIGIESEVQRYETPSVVSLGVFPNPFKGSSSIRYSLGPGVPGTAELTIFDVSGRAVRSFSLNPNETSIEWDGTSGSGERLSPGVYFCCLNAGGQKTTKSIAFIR